MDVPKAMNLVVAPDPELGDWLINVVHPRTTEVHPGALKVTTVLQIGEPKT